MDVINQGELVYTQVWKSTCDPYAVRITVPQIVASFPQSFVCAPSLLGAGTVMNSPASLAKTVSPVAFS